MELVVDEVVRPALMQPREAAVVLQAHFRNEARRLKAQDWALQEDVAQEMALAVLQCHEPGTICFFKDVARKQGIEFLSKWERHGKIPYGLGLARRMCGVEVLKTEEELQEEEQEKRQQLEEAQFLSALYQRIPRRRAA